MDRISRWIYRHAVVASVLCLVASSTARSSDLVVLRAGSPHRQQEEQIRTVAEFYGQEVRTIDLTEPLAPSQIERSVMSSSPLAILIAEDALGRIDPQDLMAALRSHGRGTVPILVFAVSAAASPSQLQRWSGGAVCDCTSQPGELRPRSLEVANVAGVSGALGGQELPAVATPTCRMRVDVNHGAQLVLSANEGGSSDPVLVRRLYGPQEVYFSPEMQEFDNSWVGDPLGLPKAFSSLAPFFLFLQHAVGTRGWHLDGHYANFTVDDPWLRQPYGHLDYPALLSEMERHNFHTTIAFVPWNFDRSDPRIVALIRAHPDRFSIGIHGNDHKHQEFGDYRTHPLPDQVAAIKQSVARMERFTSLTGVPYDRFMVFPHAVAPEPTLLALKEYGFLGTANSVNVPLGMPFPKDPSFLFRPYTQQYGSFLSLFRYPASEPISKVSLAVHCFLGNPILFYGHEDLFEVGVGQFDQFADFINKLQPDTHWTGLGSIAKHLNLIRQRDDGSQDVRMFSSDMELANQANRETVFHISATELSAKAVSSVSVDESAVDFSRSADELSFNVKIPAGTVRRIHIVYWNEANLAHEVPGKGGVGTWLIREVSDLRDIYLSRVSIGRAIRHAYYSHGWTSLELKLESVWPALLLALGVIFVTAIRWRLRLRAR